MSDGVRETPCTCCVHRTVCKYKDDFLKAIQMTKAINYDFVSDISVTCRYHALEVAIFREDTF